MTPSRRSIFALFALPFLPRAPVEPPVLRYAFDGTDWRVIYSSPSYRALRDEVFGYWRKAQEHVVRIDAEFVEDFEQRLYENLRKSA